MINFKDKKILITGATGGIGKEIVRKFVSLDGNVLATGTKIENLEQQKVTLNEQFNKDLAELSNQIKLYLLKN